MLADRNLVQEKSTRNPILTILEKHSIGQTITCRKIWERSKNDQKYIKTTYFIIFSRLLSYLNRIEEKINGYTGTRVTLTI